MKLVLFFGIIIITTIFILKVDTAAPPLNARSKSIPPQAGSTGASGRSNPPKKMVRVPVTNVPYSPELIEINNRLTMDGIKKELTKKQALWIDRFVKSTRNWLYLINNILKTTKLKDLYTKHLQNEFDIWITGRKDQAFIMTYKNENNPAEAPLHYKLIIYRISLADIAFVENLNIKSFEIGFKRSKEKMTTPKGGQVYRKDRVYILELEAEFPQLDVKIRHEIVQGNEQGDFDPLKSLILVHQDVKPGHLRMRLNNVKIYIKVFLTEIDKRFVHEDPKKGETYYFTRPEIPDLKFSVGEAQVFDPEFQYKPNLREGLVGKNLPKSRADKILKDFAYFLVKNEYETERNYRLKIALINRYSKAIMLSKDVLRFVPNLDEETFYYAPDLPEPEDDPEDVELAYKLFYMSYSMTSFFSACKDYFFKALAYQSDILSDYFDESELTPEEQEKKAKKDEENQEKLEALGIEAEQWFENQAAKANNGVGVLDDGFDWEEII